MRSFRDEKLQGKKQDWTSGGSGRKFYIHGLDGVGDITISGVQDVILTTCADLIGKWRHETDRSIWNLRNIKHEITFSKMNSA
jgi:hypothetical protein